MYCSTSADVERETLLIRNGKNKRDRMVPVSRRALDWLERYIHDVRPTLVLGQDDGTLFLTSAGESFTPNRLTQLVRQYVKAADLGKMGSCHLFRHTMATLMLEGGANIRFIQAMLGHVELTTTQTTRGCRGRCLKLCMRSSLAMMRPTSLPPL